MPHGESIHDYEETGRETTTELVERKRQADQRRADADWRWRQMFETQRLSDGKVESR